ncbi:MAG: hypothetical protein KIT22_15240 [Verrucomicrobiae bacterium]|nr:hypothetical protein [Verrucomicrobiae bacterium]
MLIAAVLGAGMSVEMETRADQAPYRPDSDETTVAHLRPSALPAVERELRHRRRILAGNPTHLPLAASIARDCIVRAREEADPRFLGGAVSALEPWWNDPSPDPEILILRGTIRQGLHEFDRAIADLRAAVERDPRRGQAWLTLASIHCVQGDFPAARRAALHVAELTDPLTATTLAAQIASLNGRAQAARKALESVLQPTGSPAPRKDGTSEVLLWAGTLLAEISARLGDVIAAERHFRTALELSPRDPYLLASFSDFLLDQRRPEEAACLLRGRERSDALLLRLAEASRDPQLASRFGDRMDAALNAGVRLHLREAARYELRLRRRPAVALRLAQENWNLQREPADVRLLCEAAAAARDQDALRTVQNWIQQTGLEDVALPKIQPPGHSSGTPPAKAP